MAPERPNPRKCVRIFVEIVNNSGVFGDEVLKEEWYDEEEYHDISSANAAAGSAIFNLMRTECQVFNCAYVYFTPFEEVTDGIDYGVFRFYGPVTMWSGEQLDLTVTVYLKNTNRHRIFNSHYI